MSYMEENLNLEFRKIPSLQFLYEVNSNGTIIRNVKSKRHLKLYKWHSIPNEEYWRVMVSVKKRVRNIPVHVLVAECWLGPRPEGLVIDHIDRDSLNNDYHNLRYVSQKENVLNSTRIQPVKLVSMQDNVIFSTMKEAAQFLSEKYGVPYGAPKWKLHQRRSHIYDYDVIYLNAETACSNQNTTGKEQSTQYLVGTLDRWNDAKRAEERDRVKHGV